MLSRRYKTLVFSATTKYKYDRLRINSVLEILDDKIETIKSWLEIFWKQTDNLDVEGFMS